jgi:alpha-mannosidase
VRGLVDGALRSLGRRTSAPCCQVLNTLGWDRGGVLALPDVERGLVPADPKRRCQRITDVRGRGLLLVQGLTVPALGAVTVELKRGRRRDPSSFRVGARTVRTPHASVRFDRAGRIVSFVDRAHDRQLVREGGAFNTFWIGQDVPKAWDNWDIDFDQQSRMKAEQRMVSRKVVADGPLQLRLRSTYDLGDASRLVQDMVFHADTPRVDFETVVEWAELHTLLKAGFTVDVLSERARHEIQYGHVERPTHRNRMHDRARFEVCNHRWTDLSENRFGVALLNDCKYGISVDGGDMRLTLLKSGRAPDPRGDRGTHVFTYAMLPHDGGFSAPTVIRPAHELNVPLLVRGNARGDLASLLRVDVPNVIVEAVKWAEDGDAVVVRLYESERSGTEAVVTLGFSATAVAETNMLEENPRPLGLRDGRVRLRFRPFEIKTLRVDIAKQP